MDNLNLENSIEDVANGILDEICLGLCFEVHKACKRGTFFVDETDEESQKHYVIIDERGLDVFGQVPTKKQMECICPNCQRNMAASRFAPHLEKCMGMGRNSSRIASRRIANVGKKDSDNESDNDNDQDNDWSYQADRKVVKKNKKDKTGNSPRSRGKNSKYRNGDIPSVGGSSIGSTSDVSMTFPANFEAMNMEEKKALLLTTCGVISEHTKRMCTRSHRCPQHTDEQRHAVRLYLLGSQSFDNPGDDVQIDIDSYENDDTQLIRDSIQWDAVSNPSPTDSTSTVNSTESRKRMKTSKNSQSKKNKKYSTKPGSVGRTTPSSMYEFS